MELIYQSTSALVEAIRSRKVSSEEIVQARINRIEDVNAKLNAAGGADPPTIKMGGPSAAAGLRPVGHSIGSMVRSEASFAVG